MNVKKKNRGSVLKLGGLLEWWLVVVLVLVGVSDGCYISPSISQTVSPNCRTVARALSNFLNLLLWQLDLKALDESGSLT